MGRVTEFVTDQAGRYRPPGNCTSSAGENLRLDLENRRRSQQFLAEHIEELVHRENPEAILFAAIKEVHNRMLERLSPATRAKIECHLDLDLTRVPESELLDHFGGAIPK